MYKIDDYNIISLPINFMTKNPSIIVVYAGYTHVTQYGFI